MALVLITHDMGVVAETAQRVQVMYAGQMVEEQPTEALFAAPRHPYTAALLDALPERAMGRARLPTIPGVVPGIDDRPTGLPVQPALPLRRRPLPRRCRRRWPARPAGARAATTRWTTPAEARGMTRADAGARTCAATTRSAAGCSASRGMVKAVDGVSFTLRAAETLAVVGESGCGKSTLARMATLMEPPTGGELLIDGKPTAGADDAERRRAAPERADGVPEPVRLAQPAQDRGLDPAGAAGHQPPRRPAPRARRAARAMMDRVGLRQDQFGRYPHMFSGGQRQRIAIARALMLNPRIVVADEPVSALDVSIQAQVLNLMMDLQDEFRLAYLFISHDLGVVRHIAREVLVLYCGRPVEQAPKDEPVRDAAPPLHARAAGGDALASTRATASTTSR